MFRRQARPLSEVENKTHTKHRIGQNHEIQDKDCLNHISKQLTPPHGGGEEREDHHGDDGELVVLSYFIRMTHLLVIMHVCTGFLTIVDPEIY